MPVLSPSMYAAAMADSRRVSTYIYIYTRNIDDVILLLTSIFAMMDTYTYTLKKGRPIVMMTRMNVTFHGIGYHTNLNNNKHIY